MRAFFMATPAQCRGLLKRKPFFSSIVVVSSFSSTCPAKLKMGLKESPGEVAMGTEVGAKCGGSLNGKTPPGSSALLAQKPGALVVRFHSAAQVFSYALVNLVYVRRVPALWCHTQRGRNGGFILPGLDIGPFDI